MENREQTKEPTLKMEAETRQQTINPDGPNKDTLSPHPPTPVPSDHESPPYQMPYEDLQTTVKLLLEKSGRMSR